eukprot:Skav200834  [mRNA]  locus=scaffold3034:149294:159358:+ [translate_table: standard]
MLACNFLSARFTSANQDLPEPHDLLQQLTVTVFPAKEPLDDTWYEGSIKSFNTQEGFGFISCNELFEKYQVSEAVSQPLPIMKPVVNSNAECTGASLLDGNFDEEAEAAAFKEAVAAWRTAGVQMAKVVRASVQSSVQNNMQMVCDGRSRYADKLDQEVPRHARQVPGRYVLGTQ